ncbi:hypothetical protein [Trichlorobacter sp.]|uniref:hypothetical protein n=1 Tax=Trichlorobacter sp. TaxID=2911007 RepID=UPI002A362112|nr:hypothetical protein [Trichlorobacter sp.]MDY0383737.1 hypothetical protein [Trichlorobacter sp.]
MIEFSVAGPFNVPVYKHQVSEVRLINKDSEVMKAFWAENQQAAGIGVYVYARKAARGYVPLYIGKTEKSFEAEVFNSRNIGAINELFHNGDKGTLVLFFIYYPSSKKIRSDVIDELETNIIQYGLKANQNLLNSKKTKPVDTWCIKGVLRGGRITDEARHLKRCLNI